MIWSKRCITCNAERKINLSESNRIDAFYGRQSPVEKEDSVSIKEQIRLSKHMFNEDSVKEYLDDGYSGKTLDRPQLQQLFKDIESGQVARLIVYKIDRIVRSTLDFANLMDLLQKHNVEFVSVKENFESKTPLGRAMLNMSIVFLQLDLEYKAAQKNKHN